MDLPVLDVNLMLSPSLPGVGLDPARLKGAMAERFREVYQDVEGRRAKGEIGFFDLPWASEMSRRVQEVADSFGQWFENVVVLTLSWTYDPCGSKPYFKFPIKNSFSTLFPLESNASILLKAKYFFMPS